MLLFPVIAVIPFLVLRLLFHSLAFFHGMVTSYLSVFPLLHFYLSQLFFYPVLDLFLKILVHLLSGEEESSCVRYGGAEFSSLLARI